MAEQVLRKVDKFIVIQWDVAKIVQVCEGVVAQALKLIAFECEQLKISLRNKSVHAKVPDLIVTQMQLCKIHEIYERILSDRCDFIARQVQKIQFFAKCESVIHWFHATPGEDYHFQPRETFRQVLGKEHGVLIANSKESFNGWVERWHNEDSPLVNGLLLDVASKQMPSGVDDGSIHFTSDILASGCT